MSKYRRLSKENILDIFYYKTIGYSNEEVANKLGCSSVTISYHINIVKKLPEESKDEVFWKVVANRAGLDTLTILKRLGLLHI